MPGEERLELTYVLPLRWHVDRRLDELTNYLGWLTRRAEVIVVDGSPDPSFDRHAARWRGLVRHMRPHDDLRFASGKVNGVITGVREATRERIVLADDDVRYHDAALARMAGLLVSADLVQPHNYFDPLPWHACWDSARSMINRAVSADLPGTLGVRRGRFLAMGGYDGDVLFENLELIRTVRAHGGAVTAPPDLMVRRLPPTTRHFLSQRVRQAYDEFARPARLAAALCILPGIVGTRHPARAAGVLALVAIALAEAGRRRGGARAVVPARVSLFAPAWLLERAVCSWLAVGHRLRGGMPYGGQVLRRAASTRADLRRRRARTAPEI